LSKYITIPPEYYPEIQELPGELRWMAEVIEEQLPGRGVELVLIFAQLFGGGPVYMHKIDGLLRQIRDDAIRKEADAGVPQKKISVEFGLCARHIIRILKQPGTMEDRQMSLF
jgi:Mor family transcriptional regulator